MSRGSDDREVLAALRDQLTASDPGLARFMTIFARLTAGEDMPARQALGRPQATAAAPQAGRPGLMRLLMLGWLLLTLGFIALAVILGS